MKKYFFILIFITFFLKLNAQNCDWTLINEANLKYSEGNFSEALKISQNCLQTQKDINQRVEALRLISKSYLALDQDSLAIVYAKQIIETNSKFEPNFLNDPPKFIEIIEYLKKITQQYVVVSISKKAENINKAPATAITLNSQDILNAGYLDFEAVLHDIPGFDISRSNGNLYTHAYQRGYRSINTNRTLFLVDGVEENDLWSSNVYLSRQYIMSDVKNLEIVYGPASTMYGSNAFLGVINIITKNPSEIIGNKTFGINARAGYGSYNTKFLDFTIGAQTKDRSIGFYISARTFLSDEQDLSSYTEHDYKIPELNTDLASKYQKALRITDSTKVADFLKNNPSISQYYFLDTNYHINLTNEGIQTAFNLDNSQLQNITFSDKTKTLAFNAKLKVYDFIIGFNYWQKQEGPGSQYNDNQYLGYNQGQNWNPIHMFFYINYEKEITKKLTFTNLLNFKSHYLGKNNRIVTYSKPYLKGTYTIQNLIDEKKPKFDSLYLFYISNQFRNESKVFYQPFNFMSFISGMELRFSSIQGDYYSSKQINTQQTGSSQTNIPGGNVFFSKDIGAYFQTTLNIFQKLNLTAGTRYDFNRIRISEGYGSVFNYRLALIYFPSTFIFKAIYATAFKDATNREKYSTATGKRELPNPELAPEKVKNYEFSFGKIFPQNSSVTIAFYNSFYSNIIQEVRTQKSDGTYTNQNQAIGQAQIYGINAIGVWNISNFTLNANYTYTQPFAVNPTKSDGSSYIDSLGNVIKKLRISDIATNMANIGINYNLKNSLNINLRANFIGKRITGQNTTIPTDTIVYSPFILLNSTITYTIKKTGLTLQLSAFNILNKEYFSPGLDQATSPLSMSLIQNKRNFYLTIYYTF